MSETSTILRKMADHIEKVGFHKGSYYKGTDDSDYDDTIVYPDRSCCTLGALFVARGDQTSINWIVSSIPIASALGFTGPANLTEWNDSKGVGIKTVLKRLRKAADELDQKEQA